MIKIPTIIVVDDNQDIVYSVKRGLESQSSDYEVIEANSGKEALKLLNDVTPDLILLDIMMSEMDGWDVVEKIHEKKEWKKIPIIFLTAKDDALSKGMASLSVEDYIVKPVDIEELDKRIKKVLKKR